MATYLTVPDWGDQVFDQTADDADEDMVKGRLTRVPYIKLLHRLE